MQRVRRFYLLKKAGMPQQARPGLTLMHIEGALGVDVITSSEESVKIEKLPQNRVESSISGIQCSTGSKE